MFLFLFFVGTIRAKLEKLDVVKGAVRRRIFEGLGSKDKEKTTAISASWAF